MDIEAIKKQLRDEEFEILDSCPVAKPNEEYPERTHPTDITHVVIKGEMHFTIDGKTTVYRQGERVDIPANAPHSMKIGPMGCEWVVGEREECVCRESSPVNSL